MSSLRKIYQYYSAKTILESDSVICQRKVAHKPMFNHKRNITISWVLGRNNKRLMTGYEVTVSRGTNLICYIVRNFEVGNSLNLSVKRWSSVNIRK